MTSRACTDCGKSFSGAHKRCDRCRRGSHPCVDCGKPAGSRWRDRCADCHRTALAAPCLTCGTQFFPMNASYKFCSAECRQAFYAPLTTGRSETRSRAERNADARRTYGERAQDAEFMRARREQHTVKRHGLTYAQIEEIVREQGGCAICKTDKPAEKKGWHVDHDHSCCAAGWSCEKCRRGVLCHRCNSGLGLFLDRADLLRAAADYLDVAPERLPAVQPL